MPEPRADRPHMPEYGISDNSEDLLPWSWAAERLSRSHNYWLATVRRDARPHVTAVWGVWLDDAFYFSMAPGSRKARNLSANPKCTVTTEQAEEAVIIEGVFGGTAESEAREAARVAYEAKYDWDTEGSDFFVVRPRTAFAFTESTSGTGAFTETATRWRFG